MILSHLPSKYHTFEVGICVSFLYIKDDNVIDKILFKSNLNRLVLYRTYPLTTIEIYFTILVRGMTLELEFINHYRF